MKLTLAAVKEELRFCSNSDCHAVGVGMTEAAASTAKLLAENPQTELVIFIGSCGVSTDLEIMQCYYSSSAVLYEPGYKPEALTSKYSSPKQFEVPDAIKLPRFRSANAIEPSGAVLTAENMEIFGVAASCAKFNVPWLIISTATNHLTDAATNQWLANKEAAAEKTAGKLTQFLQSNLQEL